MSESREELFALWERKVEDLRGLNPYRNPYVFSESDYKDMCKRMDWLMEELPSLLLEGKERVKFLSPRGENKDLVNYLFKLRDLAESNGQDGEHYTAEEMFTACDNIAKYLNGELKEIPNDNLFYYSNLMGKPYDKYARIMYVNGLTLEDLYGTDLNSKHYKKLINDTFKLLKPLMVNNEVSEFVISNYLGLDLITLVVLNLFRKDGYDFKVTLIDKGLRCNVTEQQANLYNKLSHLITCIQRKDLEFEYGSLLTFRKGNIVIMGGK